MEASQAIALVQEVLEATMQGAHGHGQAARLLEDVQPTVNQVVTRQAANCSRSAASVSHCAHGCSSAVHAPMLTIDKHLLVDFHYCLGLQQYLTGQLLASTVSYFEALKLNPSHTLAWKGRGLAWLGLGVPSLALRNLRKAAQLQKNNHEEEVEAVAVLCAKAEALMLQEGSGPELSFDFKDEGKDCSPHSSILNRKEEAIARYEEAVMLYKEGFYKTAAHRYLACLRLLDIFAHQADTGASEEDEVLRRLKISCLLSVASACVARCQDFHLARECCRKVLGDERLSEGHAAAVALKGVIKGAWESGGSGLCHLQEREDEKEKTSG